MARKKREYAYISRRVEAPKEVFELVKKKFKTYANGLKFAAYYEENIQQRRNDAR